MSYADRLQKLVEYQTNIRSALEAKGATISSDATLKDFPSAVDTITGDYTGPTPVDFVENGMGVYASMMSNATKIGSYTFCYNQDITEANFPRVSTIGAEAFSCAQSLRNIYFPNVTSIGNFAFAYCNNISIISFPKCEWLGRNVFSNCSRATTVSLPELTGGHTYGGFFENCSSLTVINLPKYNSTNTYGLFSYCTNLKEVSLPSLDGILGYYTFYNCYNLREVYAPLVTGVQSECFSNCSTLATLSFPNLQTINNSAFVYAFALTKLYILSDTMVKLSASNAFNYSPISRSSYTGSFGSVFVKYGLLDSYKSSTNWVTYADRLAAVVPFSATNLNESDSITAFVEGKESPIPLEVPSTEFTYSVYSKYPKYTGTQADVNENGEINIPLPTDGVTLTVNTTPEDATVRITENGIVNTYTKTKLLNSGDTVDYMAYKELDETKPYYYTAEHNTITVNNDETLNVSLSPRGYDKVTVENVTTDSSDLKTSILTLFNVDGDALKSKLDCRNSNNESGYFVYTTPNTVTKLRFSAYHEVKSYSNYASIVLRISTVLDENSYTNYSTLKPSAVLQDGNILCVKVTQDKTEYEVELEPSTTYYFQEFYTCYGTYMGTGANMYIEDLVLYEDLGKVVPIFATNADKVYGLVNNKFSEGVLLTGDIEEFTYTAYADGKPKITGTQADVDSSGALNVTFPENGVTLSASSAQDGSKIRFIQDYHYVTMGNQVVVNSGDTVEVEGLNPFYSSEKTKVTVDTDKHIDIELTELKSTGNLFSFSDSTYFPELGEGKNTNYINGIGICILNKDILNLGDYAICCIEFITPPDCEYKITGLYTSDGGMISCKYIAKLSTTPLEDSAVVGSNRVTEGDLLFTEAEDANSYFTGNLQGGTHYYLYLACIRKNLTYIQTTGYAFTIPNISFTKTN